MTAILFDLDGVLVDSRTAIARSLNHALREGGHPERPAAELCGHIGPALADAFAELLTCARDDPAVAASGSAIASSSSPART
jgi:phosphoglycolate phosphatase